MQQEVHELLARALEGDSVAVRALVERLSPVVQSRVARALLRSRARGRPIRQEVADLTQEVFVALFRDDARKLRAWEPARGLDLRAFVGLVSEREVASILRSGRRSPWTEEPTESQDLDRRREHRDPEQAVAERQHAELVLERLEAALSPLGRQLFVLLWVEGRSVQAVCDQLELSADAVYAWRSRIRKTARKVARDIDQQAPAQTVKA